MIAAAGNSTLPKMLLGALRRGCTLPYLRMLPKDNAGEPTDIPLPEGRPFTIGRSKSCSCSVRDPKMSRVHCELSVSGGIAILADLGSMNGTHVNGKRIASVGLKDGDLIQVGYTQFRYNAGEPKAKAAPAARPEAAKSTAIGRKSGSRTPVKPPLPRTAGSEQVTTRIKPSPAAPPPLPSRPAEPRPAAAQVVPDCEAIAASLRIIRDAPPRPLRKGEKTCSSCRQPVTIKEIKAGEAQDLFGQVCCRRCRESDPLIGQNIAGCRIDAKLGVGAWFASYKAEQLSMARPVTLRVLRREIASDPELVTNLLAAVKRSGQISHPNLVRIFDIGRADDFCYVCCEYVAGESLEQLPLAKAGMPVREAVELVAQIAGALDVAHRRDVFHRDIRPANVILNDERVPKLAGLGFLPSLEAASAAGGIPIQHSIDVLRFWPPECMLRPERADRTADIYSLGILLYALLVGRTPFDAADGLGLVRQVQTLRPRPLDAVRRDIPQRFSAVVAKAVAKNPADRYPDCQQFIRDLRTASGAATL